MTEGFSLVENNHIKPKMASSPIDWFDIPINKKIYKLLVFSFQEIVMMNKEGLFLVIGHCHVKMYQKCWPCGEN